MKIAVITGASSGMGREFAIQIDKKYGKLDEIWIVARRKERLMELERQMRLPVRVISMDLTNMEDMKDFETMLKDLNPEIKLLVNCAGFGMIGRFDELDVWRQGEMIDTNCKALTLFTGLCLSYISNHSRIINVASSAGFAPQPYFNVYAATKAYVLNYSRALNAELRNRKITVTAVCPGPVDTEFFHAAGKLMVSDSKKKLLSEPAKVVAQAIKDAALGNDISVYGAAMKSAHLASKILPDKLIMKIFKE